MNVRPIMKFVRRGAFAAEFNVEIFEEEGGWAPYLFLEDAYKLDDVRDALRAGDVERASRLAERVYRLTPIDVSGQTTGGADDVRRNLLRPHMLPAQLDSVDEGHLNALVADGVRESRSLEFKAELALGNDSQRSLLRKACSAELLPEATGRGMVSGGDAAFAGW